MSNPKSPAWYGGGISTITGDQPGIGTIFYVDGTNGSNSNTGLRPDVPVLTLTYALSLCVNGNNDYIIVLGYPGAASGEAWPVVVNKAKVHIIGTPSQASPSPLINAPADTDCFSVTGSNVEIAGLEFTAGATSACISTNAAIWKLNVHHNYFGWQDAAQDGIRLSDGTNDCPQCWIHDNYFGDKLTRYGIWISYNSTRTIIERNVFLGVASGGIGVYVDQAGAAVGAILDNTFVVADAATGEAITLIAGTASTMVFGNRAGQSNVAMTLVPYRDLGSNNFGINYYDIRAIMPVTV
jgi:hypothetical protein